MKLTPASRALATIRPDVASSVGPPNIMVPRQIGEIFRPLRPRERYCMGDPLYCHSGAREARTRNDEFRREALRLVRFVLQYLKHAAGHGDTAFVDGHFGGDEDQAAGGAHHMRLRD